MSLTLKEIFPNVDMGLNSIGFFFGAGASKEAGYPLTKELTINVINSLDPEEKKELEEILKTEGSDYNLSDGRPDIEIISDLLFKYQLSGNEKVRNIINSIQEKIINEIISIENPNIHFHVNFLKALKKLVTNRAESIWIFTTNYDLLFEIAAMKAKVPIYNAFEGILYRYFDIERFKLEYGNIKDRKFHPYPELKVKLIKLHGSISWIKEEDGRIYEVMNFKTNDKIRSMILPRKQKIMDTLEHPYDKLFRYAYDVIGNQCKYIVSCGYSFRDQHINEQLILPKLRENKIRFMALFKEEPANLNQFKQYPSFNYVTESKIYIKGEERNESTDLWKFSKFVSLFTERAGMGGP